MTLIVFLYFIPAKLVLHAYGLFVSFFVVDGINTILFQLIDIQYWKTVFFGSLTSHRPFYYLNLEEIVHTEL